MVQKGGDHHPEGESLMFLLLDVLDAYNDNLNLLDSISNGLALPASDP